MIFAMSFPFPIQVFIQVHSSYSQGEGKSLFITSQWLFQLKIKLKNEKYCTQMKYNIKLVGGSLFDQTKV